MRMDYDDVAWERSDAIFDDFKKKIITADVLLGVTHFMASHRPEVRPVDRARIADMGAFNLCFRMVFEDGFSSLLRFPCPGRVMYPEEKVRKEVAVMTFLKQNTSIPVPNIIHYGMSEESLAGLGPFILMEYVASVSDLATQLRAPGYEKGDCPYLNPDIEESKLEFLYGQVADILLELSRHSFDKIGSVGPDGNGWTVNQRPLTMNMNELVQLENFPPSLLPQSTFTTASSYYQYLAGTEFLHLKTQRNDAVDSEQDCRSKYVARKLFCKMTSDSSDNNPFTKFDSGPFKLFCDDLRPTNILLDDNMKIAAVIDWEFTYAAPVEFTYSPPWWLLIEMPEEWPRGIPDWIKAYQPRLATFLRVLKRREDASIANRNLEESQRLSGRTQESWESGDFWVNYGARKSWAFDAVWPMMDARFFGGDTALQKRNSLLNSAERIALLSTEDREAMQPFVRKKLEDRKCRKLDDWE